MKVKIKQPKKLHILRTELKNRNMIQNLFVYAIGAFGFLSGVYEITSDERIREAALIICVTGIPIVAVATWFHGKVGKDPGTKMELLLIMLCALIGGGFAIRTLLKPTPLTILIRMMDSQENWFKENILKEFEEKNHCKIIIKRFIKETEVIETLKTENALKNQNNVSLVKTPLPLTLVLQKTGRIKSIEDILQNDLELSQAEIESELRKIKNAYDPLALKMCLITTMTGEKLFFLPRKLETRFMIYRKSKVADAVNNWNKYEKQLNAILKQENGYGLPRNYKLESDVNNWDYYDVLNVAYYWANTEDNGKKTAKVAHRSMKYAGTVRGLIDRALQLGANEEHIIDMYRFSDQIIDMLQWEAVFRKYDLYHKGMWKADGWSGSDIYKGFKQGSVYLAWMHQLDCLLIRGDELLGIEGCLDKKEDLGIARMPLGVSFELTELGKVKTTGTREAFIFGWYWGVVKDSPEPKLAYDLARFITSREYHQKECKNFFLIPVRKDTSEVLKKDIESSWKYDVYSKTVEQLTINGENFVPIFNTFDEYQDFLDKYNSALEEVIKKRRYSPGGPGGKIDKDFIREHLH